MWTQRDQFTSNQLPLSNRKLIEDQYHRRMANNASHNQKVFRPPTPANISDVAIVYIKSECNKTQSRPRYIATFHDGSWYHLKKFAGDQLRNNTYKVQRN